MGVTAGASSLAPRIHLGGPWAQFSGFGRRAVRCGALIASFALGAVTALQPIGASAATYYIDMVTEVDDLGYNCIPEERLEAAYSAVDKGVALPRTCLPKPCDLLPDLALLAELLGRDPTEREIADFTSRHTRYCNGEDPVIGNEDALIDRATRGLPQWENDDTPLWQPQTLATRPLTGAQRLAAIMPSNGLAGWARPASGGGGPSSSFGNFGGGGGGSGGSNDNDTDVASGLIDGGTTGVIMPAPVPLPLPLALLLASLAGLGLLRRGRSPQGAA